MAEPIVFYFEFASPYGYFASRQIDELAESFDRTVQWRPVMLGAMMKQTGARPLFDLPLKADYARQDIPRFARFLGVPLAMPSVLPMNSLASSRAYYWLLDNMPEQAHRVAQAFFHAHWGEGRDLSPPEIVADVAAEAGVDRETLLAGIGSPEIKARLRGETERAMERGVFGSPFFLVDGQPFWGADRIPQIRSWLERGGW
ncbi:2-hydroxychromene-2-carboxylate isomerase [Marinivivus vitaminiproducens]|uniref:2-hydroxychromene-2-carboxylate isomerase n=1 Tax=Marinivivus vitaminiproducens TaxID=3035935 RepID=UPI0027A78F7E|nr:2-hydroxychromene-2-carboxylate isomerase [Geminicoccaceae bacterium SCSIO 64248]